jgi:hypothetical protein
LHRPARFRELRQQQAVMPNTQTTTWKTAIRATVQQANIFSNPGKPTFEATLHRPGVTFNFKKNRGASLATEGRIGRTLPSLASGTFPSGSKG